jgi:isoquinoline 1-oxidoreductase beta subunit
MDRRSFLRVSLGAGGALLIASCSDDDESSAQTSSTSPSDSAAATAAGTVPVGTEGSAAPVATPFEPNLFVRVDTDGSVRLTVHRSEMGQGVRTALAMVLAEELEVDLDSVTVLQSQANEAIGSQVTSGSGSITDNYDSLRAAGAVARQLLMTAAAQQWQTDVVNCRAETGDVVNTLTDERLGYGELVAVAATLDVPTAPLLKDPASFRLVGTSVPRLEGPDIVTGRLQYGIDMRVPGMRFGAVARCPVPGGTVVSFDDQAALAVAGVEQVVEVASGVAVIATSTWAAFRGRDALAVVWDEGSNATWSTDTIRAAIGDVITKRRAEPAPADLTLIEAVYETPYLPHSAMEPVNCLADVRNGACQIWTSTQNPLGVQDAVGEALSMPVTVNVQHCGGGFGRRLEVDFAVEAAEVSKAAGLPVLVTFSRTDDLQHDYPHAPTQHWLRAGWDASNTVSTLRHVVAGPGLNGIAYTGGTEVLKIEQAVPYRIAQKKDSAVLVDVPLPTGPWRGTFAWPNSFATECFLDEIAAALVEDSVELRRRLLPDGDRLRAVLDLAVANSDWGTTLPAGQGLGVACHTYHDTPVALVARVQMGENSFTVSRVVCAVDCGTVVNPDMVVQQIEGGVAFGLGAVLKGALTHLAGRVEQQNFNDAALLQLADMPVVEVHIVPSTGHPTGVGEMAVPVVIPAVLNAVYAASAIRFRSLPLVWP